MDQPAVATAETAENANNTTPNPRQQRLNEQRKPAAQTEGAVPQGGAQEDNPEAGATAAPANNQQPPTQPNQKRAPIAGGMLNGKAIYLPLPEVPASEATGVVMVQILIDEQGTVIEARAISGPPNLHGPATNAARLARFTPTMLMGEPVRVTGTLSYNFARAN
jgi:protein TonB